MSLISFDKYKTSKKELIGKYPHHWNLSLIKYETYVKARVGWHGLKSDDFTEEGPYLVTGTDFQSDNINWEGCYHCDIVRYEQDPFIQLKNGDLLITKDGTIGKVALVSGLDNNEKATLNSGIFVVRPLKENISIRYYFWLLQSSLFSDFINHHKQGSTIIHLYQDTFLNFSFPFPELKEQNKIVAYLDRNVLKTNSLIIKLQQLIELLNEKRQAVISHAVTKGLNPNVPMKDSGVEWLGKTPTLWNVCHLKHLAKIRNGQDYKSIEADTGFPVIGSGGQFAYAKNYIYDKPSVLLGRKGTIDKPLYMDSCFWAVDTMFYTEVNKNIIAKYLYYISTTIQFEKYSTNTALPSMTQENLGNYSLCYSLDPDEQQNILDFIELKTTKIDTLIQKQLQQIDLLKERRTALIAAAVTGKIDLRNWTPPASSTEASLTAEEATA